MLKKVAVERKEIYRLIKMNLYKEAMDCLNSSREMINKLALIRVNKYLENEIILDSEKRTFINVIENDINKRLLENESYILMDENDIDNLQEKIIKIKSIKKRTH